MSLIKIDRNTLEKIASLYENGYSSFEIAEKLQLKVSTRQIQRRIQQLGIARGRSEAFNNAIKRGRVTYQKKLDKMPKRKRLQNKIRVLVYKKW